MEERLELKEMEQREALCSRAVGEILQRKERATAELQVGRDPKLQAARPHGLLVANSWETGLL